MINIEENKITELNEIPNAIVITIKNHNLKINSALVFAILTSFFLSPIFGTEISILLFFFWTSKLFIKSISSGSIGSPAKGLKSP